MRRRHLALGALLLVVLSLVMLFHGVSRGDAQPASPPPPVPVVTERGAAAPGRWRAHRGAVRGRPEGAQGTAAGPHR
ncbi:hypothetical protein G6F61_014548 [Rhizopus arrhizus]|nr:hypothetical protein G6F61_014548 [Rhizopus arrhizus]